MTRTDIDTVIRTLKTATAKLVMDNIEGSLKFGTGPVRQSYMSMCHTDLITDLEQVTGFISVAQYPSQMNLLSAEWGSVSNVRFMVSSLGSQVPASSFLGATVYNTFITGMEAYSCIELDEASANFIYRPLGYGDDPLLLRQSAGYKFANAQVITNDSWIINLRSTRAN